MTRQRYPYDLLIVGAGLYGAVAAHAAHLAGKHALVIERRKVVGGNIRCEDVEGIDVHKYGAHIFHTADQRVWDFVTGLVPFNRFTNSPLADYRGERYNLPFNMNTFHALWGVKTPAEARERIEAERTAIRRRLTAEGVTEPRNLEEQALLLVGEEIYTKLIKGYTEKQWGRDCRDLPAFIIRRLPLRLTYDNNYFSDPHQGIPSVRGGV